MEASCNEERSAERNQEDGRWRADAVLAELESGTDNHGHHDHCVEGRQESGEYELPLRLAGQAHDGVDHDGDEVVVEGDPVGDVEGGDEGTHQHEEDRAGADHGAEHQHGLVDDVHEGDVVVDLDGGLVVVEQVEDVGDGGRDPAPPLVEELVEALGRMGVGIRSGRVFDTIASLQKQSAKPSIFALIVLDVVHRLLRLGRVLAHHVVVHEGLGAEEAEASGTTHDTPDHMFSGLLQPMTNGILEELIPDHRARANGVDAPACRAQVLVLLHQVDEQADGRRLEVDVAVQGEDVCVLGKDLLAVDADGELHEPVAEKVVHVHALRPSLLVPDLGLVLEMDEHLGLAGERVDQTASIGSGHFLGRPQPDVGLMDVASSLVDTADELLDEVVALHPVLASVADLEGVVEKDVRLELVVVGVDDLEVLLRHPPGGLILVHPEQRLEHLHHLRLGLVPHGGARVDPRDRVRRLGLGGLVLARLGVVGDGLVVLADVVDVVLIEAGAVELELLRLDFTFVIPTPIQAQRLVDQERAVHGGDEELLGRGQSFASWHENVNGDPGLREQPN